MDILLLVAAVIGGILITIFMPKLADKFCSVHLSEDAILRNEQRRRRNNRNRGTGAIPAILANMTEEERSKILLEVLIIQSWSPEMKNRSQTSSFNGALERTMDENPVVESENDKEGNRVDEENQIVSLDKHEKDHEENMCAICMEDYKENDEVTNGVSCSHMYHKDCLLHWMSSNHDFCPYCREYFFDVAKFSSVAEKLLGSERYHELVKNDDPTVVSLYTTTEITNENTNTST